MKNNANNVNFEDIDVKQDHQRWGYITVINLKRFEQE